MNKDTIKGIVILAVVVLALAVGATVATENGWHKLSCMARAVLHGVSLSNVRALCT